MGMGVGGKCVGMGVGGKCRCVLSKHSGVSCQNIQRELLRLKVERNDANPTVIKNANHVTITAIVKSPMRAISPIGSVRKIDVAIVF